MLLRWTAPITVIAVTLAYFAAGKLGLQLAFVQANATPVWPPTGISLAAFLLLGYRIWPAVALGAFLVNVTTEGNVATSLGIALGNTLEGVVGAYFARRFCGGTEAFDRPQDVLRYTLLVAGASTMLSATFGVTSLSLGGFSDWARYGAVWVTWWLGNAAGALIVAPLLVLWSVNPHLTLRRPRVIEAALLALSLAASGATVFGWVLPAGATHYALDFMAVPPLVWAAFRFGQRETATAAFALSLIALAGTLSGLGPFARSDPNESLLLLQAFVGITGVGALLFASLVAVNRRVAQAEALEERLRFETLLSELFAGLIQVPARQIDAALHAGLRRVVEFLDVDRGNLDEYGRAAASVHISYALPGLDEAPRVIDREHFPWTAEQLVRRESVAFTRVEELPEEALRDRASYRCVATRSKLALPLRAGGHIIGALSFGSVRRERAWSPELVERLRLLCEAFASALERKRVELSLAERLTFEALLSTLTARMSDLSGGDFDREVQSALAHVVDFLGVGAGSLLEFARDGRRVRTWETTEWLDGVELAEVTLALQNGDPLEPRVGVPLLVGGAIVGGLVFDRVGDGRVAPEELWQQLHLLGEVFANALSRSQTEVEAERLRQDLAHIGRVSAVGELTASLAHELNQPLSAILSNAQAAQRILEAAPADLAEIQEILRDIVADDKRAGEVIRRLRALLKKGELERRSLDVNDIVGEVARLVRSDAAMRSVSIRVELTRGLPRVRGDRVQLQQVVLNLVLNALDAMHTTRPTERRLVIRTRRDGDSGVLVAVEDSGTGIDEKDEERLFEPLYTTKGDGLGMGLAIARTIVTAHGGRLRAENNADGGATFHFTLPSASATA